MKKTSIKKWTEKFILNNKEVEQKLLLDLNDNFYVQSEKYENSVHLKGNDGRVYCHLNIKEGNLFFINHITGNTYNKVDDKFIKNIYATLSNYENQEKFFNNSYGKIILSENIDILIKSILIEYRFRNMIRNEEIDDMSYQEDVIKADAIDIPKEPQIRSTAVNVWQRDPKIAKREVIRANYQCSIDKNHKTFIAKATDNNYVEVHHLIPISKQEHFKKSLDVAGNIVVLCPNCHKKLHYAVFDEKKDIIEKLYDMKLEELKAFGIEISLDRLLDMYR
ncbi:HNH endonuclease [Clostridium ragsdalei P11]|uniref:HNH endonuclease n=1 Tax=Clostridium ragsdalei P11 TaxID=1353534 RepID=A0A1A6ARK5_9CLOT|nr:HNH endonuclease [Clostridium ragsdalei]OBR92673.1 HNH endonuclease [Clostridium ragsdalei P11]